MTSHDRPASTTAKRVVQDHPTGQISQSIRVPFVALCLVGGGAGVPFDQIDLSNGSRIFSLTQP